MKSSFFSEQIITLLSKTLTSHLFCSFYKQIIRIVYAIGDVAIKDLEVRFGDLNQPIEKNAIWFELLAQKEEPDKQITGALYYQYQEFVL